MTTRVRLISERRVRRQNATGPSGRRGICRTTRGCATNDQCIRCAHGGGGMSAQEVWTIFERYFPGIGLNLVKQLIELHGGQLSVRSQRGEGSTFVVSLPDHARAVSAMIPATALATTGT
ncbi:HAMP domain-containing histidine kinase [Rhizobium sp. NZLR5]|uniref:ATP-binding protein n=1 Tax=unclassified Rhizobium TaxID=2613769 RepID=UPI001C831C3A|nr:MULTISPECIES: ATP-binding protein [unclassified Rhizobium]MBX5183417.1 HAMP domain-containing histidine kinase [Rhizobium sp. NZLR5]MBX5198299.1 HAMP domain-containing histidine kinase [Rhizobium sp. NZLR10]